MEIVSLLTAVCDILERQQIRFAIAGGLASNLWVSEERTQETYDIDLAILQSQHSITTIEAALKTMGHTVLRTKDMHFTRFCSTQKPSVCQQRVRASGKGQIEKRRDSNSCEDVFLYKALSKRERDIAPMTALSDRADFDRVYAEKWARKLGVWLFAKRAIN